VTNSENMLNASAHGKFHSQKERSKVRLELDNENRCIRFFTNIREREKQLSLCSGSINHALSPGDRQTTAGKKYYNIEGLKEFVQKVIKEELKEMEN